MPEAAALSATALEKRFGGVVAVAGVSLEVRCGEIHAVIGPNGAGKSTLINLLSGDMRPTSGTIQLDGRDVTRLASNGRSLLGIGRSYQKTNIFERLSAFDNARLAAQAHAPRPLRIFGRATSDRATSTRAEAAISTVGLSDRRNASAGRLSHGEQRQLEIAMVLATNPAVILLDEPLAGMGVSESQDMIKLVRGLKQGRAVLLVEHDMDAVFALADRLTVMANGEVIASGAPEEVRRHPAVRSAYLGDEPRAA